MSRVIYRLANYEGGIVPNVEQDTADEAEMAEEEGGGATGNKKRKKKIKKTGKKVSITKKLTRTYIHKGTNSLRRNLDSHLISQNYRLVSLLDFRLKEGGWWEF